MCVSQLLARLEGEVLLAAMARKVASIEITGPATRRYNNTLRGLASPDVRFQGPWAQFSIPAQRG